MKNLIEISKIVTKKKVRKIEIFDDHSLRAKNSKFNEFYEALMARQFKNDEDAATTLYNCSPTDDKYRQLKSRFRKRLLNTLFFLDINIPATSNYDRAYYSSNKDWTLVKILLSNNANSTAAALARHILTTALKFKFADVIVNCSRILRKYAADIGDEKSFEEYDQHIKQYANILDAEIRSEELYQRVILNYYKPPSKTDGLEERIDTYCQALDGLSSIYESPIVNYNKYLMWVFRYEMLRQYEDMLNICRQAEQYIQEHPDYYQEEKSTTFHLKKMSAYLHLQDAKRGLSDAKVSRNSFTKGSEEWFTFMEYYFLLAMHSGQYEVAQAVFNDTLSSPQFKRLEEEMQTKWNIFEVYLHFVLNHISHTSSNLTAKNRSAFRLSQFLSEVIEYPREHRVFTVQLVVAQILFFVYTRNYTQATERIHWLKEEANRHLKKEDYYRAVQFIRLLQQLPKADYERNQLSNTEKYLARLNERPFFYRGVITELEVLPYEKLWELLLQKLR